MQNVRVVLGMSALTLGMVYAYGFFRAPQPASHTAEVPGQVAARPQGGAAELRTLERHLTVVREELHMLRQQQMELQEALPILQRQHGDVQTALARRRSQPGTGAARKRHVEVPTDTSSTAQAALAANHEASPVDVETQHTQVRHALQTFEERLAGDVPDTDGAHWALGEIDQALEERDLPGTSLVTAQCGASLCRFEFAFEDLQGRDASLGLVPFVLPTSGGGVWFIDPEDPLRLIFFAERTS